MLLDLPLELFQSVLDCSVRHLEVRDSANLRRVNKLFDLEILRSYARTDIFRSDPSLSLSTHPSKCDFFARYLLLRPHVAGRLPEANLSALLNYLTDELMRHGPAPFLAPSVQYTLRFEVLRTLCAKTEPSALPAALYPCSPHLSSNLASDLLIAAIYTGKTALIDSLLASGQIDLACPNAGVLGEPLSAAVKTGHRPLVRRMLQARPPGPHSEIEEFGFWATPLVAAIANADTAMIRLFLEPQFGLTSPASCAPYQHAVLKALEQPSTAAIAYLLLRNYPWKASSARQSRAILSDGLRRACQHGYAHVVRLLLDHGADIHDARSANGLRPMARPLAQAAWTGHIGVMYLLLARGASVTDFTDDTHGPGSEALRAAVWGGHPRAAQMLLAAGAQLGPKAWGSVLLIAALRPDTGSAAVGRALLEWGAVRPEMLAPQTVRELVMAAAGQGNVEFLNALVGQGVSVRKGQLLDAEERADEMRAAGGARESLVQCCMPGHSMVQ